MTPDFQRAVTREILRVADRPDWRWRAMGNGIIAGPDGFAILLVDTEGGDTHVDIGIRLQQGRSQRARKIEPSVIWDCVLGHYADIDAAAAEAVNVWRQSAWATVAQLYSRGGTFAFDVHGAEADAMPGWHVILSPIQGYGNAESDPEVLQKWIADHPILPALAPQFATSIDPETAPHGAKILIGGSSGNRVAEVKIDGVVNDEASAALAALPWPTPEASAVARMYALFAHQEDDEDWQEAPAAHRNPGLADRLKGLFGLT